MNNQFYRAAVEETRKSLVLRGHDFLAGLKAGICLATAGREELDADEINELRHWLANEIETTAANLEQQGMKSIADIARDMDVGELVDEALALDKAKSEARDRLEDEARPTGDPSDWDFEHPDGETPFYYIADIPEAPMQAVSWRTIGWWGSRERAEGGANSICGRKGDLRLAERVDESTLRVLSERIGGEWEPLDPPQTIPG